MLGKLSYQLDRDIGRSLSYLDLAATQELSFVNNKPLKVALLYQTHSLRSKCVSGYLIKNTLPDESVLSALERSSFIRKTSDEPRCDRVIEARVIDVLNDAYSGLRDCKRIDAYDFKSVYRLAKVASQMSMSRALHSQQVVGTGGYETALEEISKLFDKKLPQVVAIWCLESTANPIEQITQRTHKFEALRKKVTIEYSLIR